MYLNTGDRSRQSVALEGFAVGYSAAAGCLENHHRLPAVRTHHLGAADPVVADPAAVGLEVADPAADSTSSVDHHPAVDYLGVEAERLGAVGLAADCPANPVHLGADYPAAGCLGVVDLGCR